MRRCVPYSSLLRSDSGIFSKAQTPPEVPRGPNRGLINLGLAIPCSSPACLSARFKIGVTESPQIASRTHSPVPDESRLLGESSLAKTCAVFGMIAPFAFELAEETSTHRRLSSGLTYQSKRPLMLGILGRAVPPEGTNLHSPMRSNLCQED